MRALIYTAPERLEVATREGPVPQAGERVVDVAYCGICGSDMHAFLGHDERRPAPLILGHEAAGRTEDGTPVVVNPLVTCGECAACRSGRTNLCPCRQIVSMPPREGAFAERLAVPQRNLLPVPDGLPLERAALTEPLACGWHVARLAVRHGASPQAEGPVILGGGAIGLAAALALVAHGAPGALVVEPNRARWDAIAGAGPFEPIHPDDAPRHARALVVDAHGSGRTRAAASAIVAPGGTIVHVGLADAAAGLDTRRATLQEIAFVGAYTYTAQEFAETLAAIAGGRLGPLDWFTVRPLEEGPNAFAALRQGAVAAPKVMLSLN